MLNRVSTLGFHNRNVTGMLGNQTILDDLNRQISSGKKYGDFTNMSQDGNIERVFSFESSLRASDNYLSSNTVVSNRLLGQASNIDQIISIMEKFRSDLVTARSSSGNTLPLSQIARNNLSQVEDNLNARVEGRFIFSGSKTSLPAVTNMSVSNIVGNSATAAYYNGDNARLTVRASNTLTIDYSVNAGDPAFQKAIGALHMAALGADRGDDEMLGKAVDMVNAAISELIQVRTDVNNNVASIDKVNADHENAKLYFQQVLTDITETNIPMATITMTTHQTILQASFITFSRLSQLNLSNYLK